MPFGHRAHLPPGHLHLRQATGGQSATRSTRLLGLRLFGRQSDISCRSVISRIQMKHFWVYGGRAHKTGGFTVINRPDLDSPDMNFYDSEITKMNVSEERLQRIAYSTGKLSGEHPKTSSKTPNRP